MIAHAECLQMRDMPGESRFYSPDILPRLQSVLAALADIDVAHEKNVTRVASSAMDADRKRDMIGKLQHDHRERRIPYVAELMALRERMDATFG